MVAIEPSRRTIRVSPTRTTCLPGIRRFPWISNACAKRTKTTGTPGAVHRRRSCRWRSRNDCGQRRMALCRHCAYRYPRDRTRRPLRHALSRPCGRADPAAAGFQIRDARAEAVAAAEGTTDFGEYLFYFSFFWSSPACCSRRFFHARCRAAFARIGVLSAAGFRRRDIARVFATQAAVLALIGSAVGIAGAIGYAALIMHGLRTWWSGAVGTTALTLHVNWPLLMAGASRRSIAATVALAAGLRSALARTPRALLSGAPDVQSGRTRGSSRAAILIAVASLVVAVALLVATRAGLIPQVAGFFVAGGTLMIAGLVGVQLVASAATRARRSAASLARFGALRRAGARRAVCCRPLSSPSRAS